MESEVNFQLLEEDNGSHAEMLRRIGGIRRPNPKKVQVIVNMEKLYLDTLHRRRSLTGMQRNLSRIFADNPNNFNLEQKQKVEDQILICDSQIKDLENYIIDFPTYSINDFHTGVIRVHDMELYVDYTALWEKELKSVMILEVYYKFGKDDICTYPVNLKMFIDIKKEVFEFESTFKVLRP